jgi:hypothetical protein
MHNHITVSFNRLSHAVDLIEKRSQQNRPWKVAQVRSGLEEDPVAARDRHFAAHPEDGGTNVVIFRPTRHRRFQGDRAPRR